MVNSHLISAVLCLSTAAHASVLRRNSCSFRAAPEEGDDTQDMAQFWSVDEADFVLHNPGVVLGATLEANREYCVEWAAGAQPIPSSPATEAAVGSESGGNGGSGREPTTSTNAPAAAPVRQAPPTFTQAGLTSDCTSYHVVESGENCLGIVSKYSNAFTLAQFYSWNPAVRNDCSNMWLGSSVCISVTGATVPSKTRPANGIDTPLPIQAGMVDNCDKFYFVEVGETCAVVASKHDIKVSQFTNWNPAVGKGCLNLWAQTNACVSIVGHEPSPTKPKNGITTPRPTQPGIVGNCNRFHYVSSGESCWGITQIYKISLGDFYKWNPKAGDGCGSLQANAHACVGVL